ncbi:hypothetical protein ILUMI_21976 [Ignelater luminosus]|uniref:DUF4774 domain-containing protein n=1 Tax=Ignelater luminosus TaxID=2038154 RepID=A0A8K0CDK1_IGNLU|nr:hypothetical protein ILUMI_21976 [Ignelater luminosus]
MLVYTAILTLSSLVFIHGAEQNQQVPAAPEGPAKQVLLPAGPPPQPQFSSELNYNVNLLEPQFQYPGFNYIPEKQPYPRVQPPVFVYAGAAPPGQQFLYRPGAPPGNFLVPQPQPQPGVIFGGNPQGPVFVAGYPKPAHIPPIEKDAEEVPGLAGNHPATGRPIVRPTLTARRPEKLETLDEPISPTLGEPEIPETIPSGFPKKSPPTLPPLKPGQRFFILNGHPIFSLEGVGVGAPQPQIPTLHQANPEIYVYRQAHQYEPIPQQQFNQVPVQDLFLRNAVTGQISDVKPLPAAIHGEIETAPQIADGNFISLNHPDDFRQNFYFRNVVPVAIAPQKEYNAAPVLLKGQSNSKPEPLKDDKSQSRFAKELEIGRQGAFLQVDPYSPIYSGNVYSGFPVADDYYRFADLKNGKDEDDTVVIDAKVQDDDKESEEVTPSSKAEQPSLSQAQPAAIALAGKGGVASAGPRGTALAGKKGLAVARPQATAVAGPTKEENDSESKSKSSSEKKRQ